MPYEQEVLRALAEAKADGFTGDALKIRVAKLIGADKLDIDKPGDAMRLKLLDSAFRKHVDKAARETTAKKDQDAKLF